MEVPLNGRRPTVSFPVDRPRINGWLLVFAVMAAIRCGFATYYLTVGPSPFTPEGRNLQAAVPSYLVYVLFQLVATTVHAVVPVVGLVLLFRRSGAAVTLFKAFLSFVIIDGLIELSALRLLYPSIAAAFQEAGDSLAPLDAARDQQFLLGLREVAYGGIWLLYWFRSTKVNRLFTFDEVEQPANCQPVERTIDHFCSARSIAARQDVETVTLRRTIISLLVAPLGAVAVTILATAWDHGTVPSGFAFTVVPLFILVVGWGLGLAVVLPLMVQWPRLRQPSKLKAAAAAVLIAWIPEVVERIRSGKWDYWPAIGLVTIAGIASGVLYSILAEGQRQSAPPDR